MRGTTLIRSAIARRAFVTYKASDVTVEPVIAYLISVRYAARKCIRKRRAAPLINRLLSVCRIVSYCFWS